MFELIFFIAFTAAAGLQAHRIGDSGALVVLACFVGAWFLQFLGFSGEWTWMASSAATLLIVLARTFTPPPKSPKSGDFSKVDWNYRTFASAAAMSANDPFRT